jgi:8-oxo-dGTP pyrophosphatase MutT (NUDIX family)
MLGDRSDQALSRAMDSLDRVAISAHIRRLRESVGHDLLVLPGSAVLPRDEGGRVSAGANTDPGEWAAIGGAVEPDESPQQSALREPAEEAGVAVALGAILAVLGAPEYRMTYPNGDQTSHVTTVFDAGVVRGTPRPDGDETRRRSGGTRTRCRTR